MPLSPEAAERRRAQAREYARKRREDPAFREQEREYGRQYEATKRQRDPDQKRAWGKATSRRAYAKDPEKQRAKQRAWREANAEVVKERQREYRQTPEAKAKAAEYARQWRKAHPATGGRARIWKQKGAPAAELTYISILLGDPCSYCGKPANEIDHVTPIIAGGTSDWSNLTASCSFCNRSKNDRPLLAWMAKTSRKALICP